METTTPIRIDRTTRLLAFLVLAISLSGCATQERPTPPKGDLIEEADQQPETTPEVPDQFVNERVMVNDLLSAIVQILPPIHTTVQISASNDDDLTLLVAETMARSGYGIQKVTTDQGTSLLSTDLQIEKQTNNSSPINNVKIDIGQVSVGRSYSFNTDQTIQPSSPFKVYGSRAPIEQSRVLFGADSQMASTEYLAPTKLDEPLPLLSLIAPEIVQSAVAENPGLPEMTSINSAKVEVNNLHYGESTFSSVLEGHLPIDKLTVVFPNDSITMGNENKLLIRRFIEVFIEQLDLVSVIGCSNGPTASALGNAGLALGRGERVTEELLSLGIPREKILDQGCWAPRAGNNYPGRGVVLELWREKV